MFGTAQRIGLGDSPLTEDMYSAIETEEELEQLFNAGMNNSQDKEDKEEANQQDRKDEDKNQTNDTSEETVETKGYHVICEKESSGAHKCSVCHQFVHAICGSYSEDSESFGLQVTCNLCVRKNRINIEREGAKSGQEQQAQKMVSLSNSRLQAVYIGTKVVVSVLTLVEDV